MSSNNDLRFTDSAQRIVKQIVERAGDRGVLYMYAEVLVPLALWTLIRWERKVGLAALEAIGVNLHDLADALDELLTGLANDNPVVASDGVLVFANTGESAVADSSSLSQATEPLLIQCQAEARQLNHSYVGTEHLLLAIIALADAQLMAVLRDHLITYESTRGAILELLAL